MGASGGGVIGLLLGAVAGSSGDGRAPFPWKLVLLCAALAWCAVRALEWAWWRPRRLSRALRAQGLRGTTYCSLAGDAPLTERLNREARSRPMPLGCHDVVPRAMPVFHQTMKEHGTARCFPAASSFCTRLPGPYHYEICSCRNVGFGSSPNERCIRPIPVFCCFD
jgi:hypothetical protein